MPLFSRANPCKKEDVNMTSDLLKALDEKNNITQDSFDKMVFDDTVSSSPNLKKIISDGSKVLKTFPELSQDLFASLYKLDPHLTKDTPMGTELNRKQIETFMENNEYQDIRDYTTLDDYSAGMASITVMEEVYKRIMEDEELRKLAEEQNQQDDKPNDKNKDGSPKSKEQQQQEQQEKQKQMQNSVNKASSKIRRAIRAGMEKAKQEAEENNDGLEAMGWGSENGEFKRLPFQDKQTLLEQLRKMKEVVKIIGRMKQLAITTKASKIRSNQVELCGVTMGNNIDKALPQELSKLTHPLLKYDFYRKLAEHQLLQYELKRNETVGKGHIVCLVDDSGSMYGGQRELAKGAMFALLETARADKRNFACDIFSSGGDEYKKEILHGEATMQDTMDLLTAGFCGGTSYEEPISWGIEKCQENEFKKADIVMITDGCCNLSNKMLDKLNKFKKETGTRFITIAIGGYGIDTLKKFSDSVYTDLGMDTMSDVMKEL